MRTKLPQTFLAKLFNNPLGRWYLGVSQGKRIYKITQSSAHYYTGEISKRNGMPVICTGNCNPAGLRLFYRFAFAGRFLGLISIFVLTKFVGEHGLLPLFAGLNSGVKAPTGNNSASHVNNAANAYTDDTNCADFDASDSWTPSVNYTGFGFGIGATDTIDGIICKIKAKSTNNPSLNDEGLYMRCKGASNTSYFKFQDLYGTTSITESTHGSSTDKWDTGAIWSPAGSDFSDANFKLYMYTGQYADADSSLAYVTLQVYYTEVSVVAPTVTTQAATAVTDTACTGNGNITNAGGENCTRRGFCYMAGSSGDPTTANSVAYDDGSFGTGAYTKGITGLSAGTAYRVRAYAVNSAGTGYGSTVQVNTKVLGVTKTVTAKARVKQLAVEKTVTAKARVKQAAVAKTVTALGRVKQAAIEKTVTAKGRVKQLAATKTVQALGRIKQVDVTKTIQAQGRIKQADVAKTIQAKADIKKFDVAQTVTAKAKIGQTSFKTIQAKARIFNTTSQTVQGKAAIKQFDVTKTVQAQARIRQGGEKTIQARSRIKATLDKTVDAKGRILATQEKTVTAQGRIKHTDVTKTVTAKAAVRNTVEKTIQAKGRIKQLAVAKTVTAKAFILVPHITKTVTAKARVVSTPSRTVQSRARIKKLAVTKTVTAKGRIKQAAVTKTVQAKGRIKQANVTKTVTAKGRIKQVGVTKTIRAKGRIKQLAVAKTVTAKAKLWNAALGVTEGKRGAYAKFGTRLVKNG